MSEKEKTVATVPAVKAEDEQKLGREVSDIEFRAEAFIITSDDDYKAAGEFGTMLKKKAAEVTSFFKPMKDSAYQAHKAICDREKTMLAPLKNAESIIKKSMSGYLEEQERLRKEREEALRKAAEEERERKLREAVELDNAGNAEEAEAAFQDAVVMDEATTFCTPAVAKPKVAGVSTSKDWEITEIDPSVVPDSLNGVEIRPVDKAAVMRLIRASKGTIKIPGIAYKEVAKMSFSRR